MTLSTGKKIISGVLIVLIGILSASLLIRYMERSHENSVKGRSTLDTAKASPFKEISKPIYLPPVQISFKDKAITIEEVGVEPTGEMGVPEDWQKAGWYKNGAKAGEEGNTIVDGHYDTNTGLPAAFWELKDLQLGDKVTVTDRLGRNFHYLVAEKSHISIRDPERAKVFESGKDKVLTLITCGGVWDYTSGTYDKRLVITAKFDKMEKSF